MALANRCCHRCVLFFTKGTLLLSEETTVVLTPARLPPLRLQSQAESQGETGPAAEGAPAAPAVSSGAAGSHADTLPGAGAEAADVAGQAAPEQATAEAAAAAPLAQRSDSLDVGAVQQAWEATRQMGVEYTAPGGQQVSEQYAAVEGQYPGGQVRCTAGGAAGLRGVQG